MEHGCQVCDTNLRVAVMGGHFDCVKLLVTQGLPQEPLLPGDEYLGGADEHSTLFVGPKHLRCLQYILDAGGSIHTRMLMWLATSGNLDIVRLLHRRGVGLWAGAYAEETVYYPGERTGTRESLMQVQEVIAIPAVLEHAQHMLSVLQYGWVMGAPVTPAMEEVFRAKRAATRATLLCFGVASRRSQDKGTSPEQRAAFALMGSVPSELVEKIVTLADLEIPETLHRGLPKVSGVRVQIPHPPHVVWMRNADVPIHGVWD
jgi:hypothetical protein